MNRVSMVWAAALSAILLGACASSPGGGASPSGTLAAGPLLPWDDASRNFTEALRRATSGPTPGFMTDETGPVTRIRVRPDHFSFIDRGVVAKGSSTTGKPEPYALRRSFAYNSLGDLKIRRWAGTTFMVNVWGTEVTTVKRGWGRQRTLKFASRADAESFVRAVHDLIRATPYAANSDDTFAQQAAAFRAANPKPQLSEAANRHRVVAEAATREKDFDRAIEEFEAALSTDPTWSSGNFNLALLYEATQEWQEAVRYMRRFLILEPNSREAPAARDKLILWEERARREPRP